MNGLGKARLLALLTLAGGAVAAGAAGDESPVSSSLRLHGLFQDGVVLQRERPVRVWGSGAPGEAVTLFLAGSKETVRSDKRGRWWAELPPIPAGGPHTLTVTASGGATRIVEDVRVGDVFLCSGQSNMVLPVHRTLNSRAEIAAADSRDLRMLMIPPTSKLSPESRLPDGVEWQVASPDTIRDWSATCYYFAREVKKSVRVPIGMVVAAFGGTGIRTWMSGEALRVAGGYEEELEILRLFTQDRQAAVARWGAVWEDWWRSRNEGGEASEPWKTRQIDAEVWSLAPPTLGVWEEWGIKDLSAYDGMLWYRTTLNLTSNQASQSAVLSLGTIDEIDQTWVNGEVVGASSGAGEDRRYPLAAGLLREGENRIVVNVLDTWASGGIYGEGAKRALLLRDGSEIPLAEDWYWARVPPEVGWPPRAPWDSTGGLTTSFNAMIAPLDSFAFRSVVWYQGESDTGEPERYAGLLTALMNDWRARFGADLPFLIVQLANYGAPWTSPAESGWARLREAQRVVAVRDSRAGLVVTIDLGDSQDIHPANKQEVGRRLARVARRLVYGESAVATGPVPVRAGREGGQVVVEFADVALQLVAYGAEGPIGFEVCGAGPGSCRFAAARLQDARVLLSVAGGPEPERVRYCWADNPVCTLYDAAGLPAGPFELAIE